jgi:hypothetical protein
VNSTTQPACRQTRAVDDATEVYFSDVTHAAKCAASARPATAVSRRSEPATARRAGRCVDTAIGVIAIVAIAVRQNAIAKAGTATMAAISGPDSDTPTTPTAISATSTARRRTGVMGAILAWPVARSGRGCRR